MFGWIPNRRGLLADVAELGRWGERYCCRYLKRKGFKELTRNFSCKRGEIDLVMVDSDSSIVFVEVKTRADEDFAEAESAITADKKRKLITTARYFITTNNIANRPCRFDVVIILLGAKGEPEVRYYKNAFMP